MSEARDKSATGDFIEDPSAPSARSVRHADGVYFGLAEEDYFADTALGSSDMRVLSYSPMDYWFQSRFNPLRPEKETTPAQVYGRAVHTLILEGRDKFEKMYAPKMHSWATKDGKAEKERFAARGVLPLPFEDWERAQQTGAILRGNRHLAGAFEGSVGHEVSVFWTKPNGMRCRARFDALKERAIVDLKNVSNERAISFPRACLRKIDDYSYHLQAAHYADARLQLKNLLLDGKVFGDCDHQALGQVAATQDWAFIFIFLQSTAAPIVWPTMLSFHEGHRAQDDNGTMRSIPATMNALFEIGFARIAQAEKNWATFHEKFGTDLPWVTEDPIEEFDISRVPPWFARGGEEAV